MRTRSSTLLLVVHLLACGHDANANGDTEAIACLQPRCDNPSPKTCACPDDTDGIVTDTAGDPSTTSTGGGEGSSSTTGESSTTDSGSTSTGGHGSSSDGSGSSGGSDSSGGTDSSGGSSGGSSSGGGSGSSSSGGPA